MDDLKKFILSEVQKKKMDVQTGMELLGQLSAPKTKNSEIAITGMAVRFPQADTPEEFYNNLVNKIDSVRDYPEARRKLTDPWLPDEVCDTDEPYQRQAYIDHISEFDEHFFKLSVAEAKVMEPLQRLFMMCAYEALEDANCTNTKLQDLKVGIYVGNAELGQPRYKDLSEKLDGTGFVGGANSMMPARIAYYLGLNGPGVLLDSACASGMLGVTMACEALRTGKIDYAIVCGAAMNLIPVVTEKITIMESPDTIVSPFDDNANGTVWGEGIGVVILKRAEQAYQEKDHVYAVICGDGSNNNGNSASITAVDAKAQKKLISRVWKEFNINPEHIKYVEAQGTGTLVGDSIEVKSLTQAFAEYTDKKQICGLGTSKCNIGHTIGASGIAALIKAAMSLEAGKVPPMQRFHNPNHYINFVNSPIYITDEPIELDENDPEQMIAINNFGFNGTNVHIVLKKAEQLKEEAAEEETAYPLFLSAKTEEALKNMVIQYQQYLNKTEYSLENICYTAWCGREHFEKRLAVIAKSKNEMADKLSVLNSCIKDETGKTKFPDDCFYLNSTSDSNGFYGKEMAEEALSYVQGKTVEPHVFSQKSLSKVQLPVYPFELKNRWIDKPLLETIHPITGRLVLATEEQDIYQIKLDKRSWRLDTNTVPGKTVISPDVYMEIFYQYAMMYERGSRVRISEIQIPENRNLAEVEEICAVVKKEEKQITITLQVEEKKEKEMLLATANIQFVENENEKILKAAAKTELEEKIVARETGRRDCIRKINMDEKQAVFHVELPFQYRKDEKKHTLHPALLERAMTVHYVEANGKRGVVTSCKEAVINRPLPVSFDAVIHLTNEDAVYDLELSDGEGVIADFCGVCIKEAGLSYSDEETEDSMYPEKLRGYSENGYTSTQLLLAKIWCEQLGMKSVDLDQKFFEIGGNSVIALAVMNQLSQAGIQGVTIRTIFTYQTIRELSEYLDKFEGEEIGLVRVDSQEAYPLSSEQKGILSYCMLNPESRAYNLTAVFEMTGNIQIKLIKEAFETIYQQNESFRTKYVIDEAGMKQIVQDNAYDGWMMETCGHRLSEDELGQLIYEFNEPYSLADGKLLRTKYVMEDEEHGYLLVGTHHIAADGVSMGVLFEDFITLYSGGIVPDRSRRYVDYAVFASKTDTKEYQKKKSYWVDKFSDGIPNLTLPYDYDNVEERTDKGAVFTYEIGIEQVNSLKERARELSVTASTYLLSAYSMMLMKYTGQKNIVIGMPFTGRQYKELEDVIGMFVNTLPVRIKADKEMKITEFICKMSQESAEFMEHSGYHFEELPKDLGEEGTSQNPLYQVMFTFQNTRSKVEITDVVSPKMEFSVDGMDVKSVDYDRGIARADIMLEVVERDSTYVCYFEYSTDLFKEQTIRRMAHSMDKILSQMLSQPHMYMKDLDVIAEEERQQILYQFCGPKFAIPEGYGVIPAIMSMMEQYPDKTAVAAKGKTFSYQKLNELSQKVMKMYGRYGVSEEEPVVMMLERSIELIACILGAWRIGAFYIPVGIDYPVERIKTVVETSGARYIVTRKEYISKEMKETFGDGLLYIEEEQEKEENASEPIAEQDYQGGRLAYTIFTSGSTGKPKGAMVEHAGMTNHITAKVNDLNMSKDTVIVFNASPCFDISVWQMFAALTVGGTVIVFDEEDNQNTDVFLHKIVDEQVTVLEVVPAYLRLILEAEENKNLKLDNLRYLLVTGDVVSVGLVNRWLDTFPQIPIVNAYGPTEASDDITHCILSEKLETLSVPIGKTLQNLYIYVVDDENKLCPIGVRGEILVSGIGVGRGYMNLPEQTKKVFGRDFFIPERGRLYRTGDNGYWLEDGTLMIVGRKDYQVKLHGFRIELNEITSAIESLEEVKEAVTVIVEQDGNKYLCSYYSSEHEIAEKIEDWVSKKLPYYMIPSVFVHMEELPHNDNGKVDRKKLKKPKIEIAEKEFRQAETEEEICLEQVLKQVFSIEKINMNDSFFELGGDSIIAIQVATKIKLHGYSVEIKQILKSETLTDIASSLVKSTQMKEENMEGKFPLSAMQKKYISEFQLFDTYWNQNLSFFVNDRLTPEGILAALEQLVKNNDSLRLRFKVEENEIWQEYETYHEGEFLFEEYTDLSLEERNKICYNLNEQVQVKNQITLGCLVEHQEKGDYVLLVVSHLVADTLSLRILMKEFLETYEAFKNGTSYLTGKTNSYKTMVARLSEDFAKDGEYESISYYADSSRLEELKPIWGEDTFAVQEEYVNTQIEIDTDIVDVLKEGAAKIYQSGLDVLLLAGAGMALNEVAGVSKACIFMETDMRFAQLPNLDISNTTGWCAGEYPVVFPVDCLLSDCILRAKESLDSIPFNGAGYLEVEEHLRVQGITYPAEIMFNYIGVFDSEVENGCRILRESSGLRYGKKSRHGYGLEIESGIYENKLFLELSYKAMLVGEEFISQWKNAFINNMKKIADFLSAQKSWVATPGFYDNPYITGEELQKILVCEAQNCEAQIEKIYPLTPVQQGMLFYWMQNAGSDEYFEQFSLQIQGKADLGRFTLCYKKLIEKYEVLRTVFFYQDIRVPQQVVLQTRNETVQYVDYSKCKEEEKQSLVRTYLKEDRARGFDLEKDILLRITLIQLAEDRYQLVWSFHHIILDGWSFGNLVQEFLACYADAGKELGQPVSHFSEYVKWGSRKNPAYSVKKFEPYLSGIEETTSFMGRKNEEGDQVNEYTFKLSKTSLPELKEYCNRNHISVYTSIAAAILRLLQIYNMSSDAVIGNVVSGRRTELPGVTDMVGMLINTLPLRATVTDKEKFNELAKEVEEGISLLEENAYTSLAELQTEYFQGNAFFDCVIAFENYPFEKELMKIANNTGELPFTVLETSFFEHTNYGLYISIFPEEESISFEIHYNTSRYDERDLEQFARHLDLVLQQVSQKEDILIKDISILTEEDRKAFVSVNETHTEYEKDLLAFRRFERTAKCYPDKAAVSCQGVTLSYKELNQRANMIAHKLLAIGLKKEDCVGVMMKRSVNLPAALLGIMKAGGVYVPLHPEFPVERMEQMAQDCNMEIVIGDAFVSGFSYDKMKVIDLEQLDYTVSCENPELPVSKDSPVYILYTSGTTGNPKGVVIPHIALNNFIIAMEQKLRLSEYHKILSSTNYTFDIFGLELYVSFSNGLEIILADDRERLEPDALAGLIKEHEIDMIQMTPSGIKMLLTEEYGKSAMKGLKCILAGGEKVSDILLSELQMSTEAEIYNVYGPTETTIWSTISRLTHKKVVDIGYPLANTFVYVVDEEMRQVPVMVPGELCIAGDGLALGYRNRKDLTDEKFVQNPYGSGKVYRTGDVVRFNHNMELEYIGRKDSQVKIRGHRIECEEIEGVISQYEGIGESVVTGKKDGYGNEYLVGYYVAKELVPAEQLKEFLKAKLPDYMVPRVYVRLDRIPLNASGKVNKRALPDIECVDAEDTYLPPVTNTELKLVKIWENILHRPRIGIQDNFFELGGHSLLAVHMLAEISKTFHVKLSIREIFEEPTVKALSQLIESKNIEEESIPHVAKQDEYEVSQTQKRIYLMSVANQDEVCWHMSFAAQMKETVDIEKLNHACQELINRHEILRTTFHAHGASISQKVHENVSFEVQVIKTEDAKLEEEMDKLQSIPFYFEKLFLIRIYVLESESKNLLFVDMHHIISDGVSLKNIISELIQVYRGATLEGEEVVQYKDYVAYEKQIRMSQSYLDGEKFYQKLFEDCEKTAYLIPDYRREAKRYYEGDSITLSFTEQEYENIESYINQNELTLFMFLSSTLAILMKKVTGEGNVVIGTPVSGRNHSSLLQSVGVFINTIPLRFQVQEQALLTKHFAESKKMILDCFEHQIVSFDDIVKASGYVGEKGRNPLYDVTFIMQNTGVAQMEEADSGVSSYPLKRKTVNSDMLFEAEIIRDKLCITLEYITGLYSKDTAERLIEQYKQMILDIVCGKSSLIRELQLQKEELDELSLDLTDDFMDLL